MNRIHRRIQVLTMRHTLAAADSDRSPSPRCVLLILCSLLLTSGADRLTAAPIEHVIQISVDGLQGDELQYLLRTDPARFRHFQRFVDQGATTFNARTDVFNTTTLPNHTTMVTGRPVLQPAADPTQHHGYTRNSMPLRTETLHNAGNPAVSYIASTFDMAHDFGISTALYADKSKFAIFPQSYNVTAQTQGGRPDQYLANGDQGNDKIDRWVITPGSGSSAGLVDTMISDMQKQAYGYAFLHLSDPDTAGHLDGWSSKRWGDAVAAMDRLLGRVFELVDTHPPLAGSTALVLTADHGGFGWWHDDILDPNTFTVPFMVWGPGVAADADLYRLNHLTRQDPGRTQPAYAAVPPPIRNGDAPNLSLGLLGLPPVENSYINVRQDLLTDYARSAVWDGSNPVAGQAGDGTSWSDGRNWSRSGQPDTAWQIGDAVQFPASEQPQAIHTTQSPAVDSLLVQGDYTLLDAQLQLAPLRLVSGKVDLEPSARLSLAGLTSPRGIVVDGGGTLEVNGPVSHLLLVRGTFSGAAHVQGNADILDRLAPGDGVGLLRVDRNLTIRHTSVLSVEIDRDQSGVRCDQVIVTGMASGAGMLEVLPRAGYQDPAIAGDFDRLQLIQAQWQATRFLGVSYAGMPLSFEFQTAAIHRSHEGDGLFRALWYDNTSVWLVNYRAIPGDADGDGQFSAEDLVTVFASGVYEDGDNDNADWTTGDWTGDQDFDASDFVAAFLSGQYEQGSVFDRPLAAPAIPEPAGRLLLSCGLLGLMWVLRRPC